MLSKAYTKTRRFCRVTFRLRVDPSVDAQQVSVLGDFNDWSPDTHPMEQRKDGAFSRTISVEAGKSYHFRYLVDGRWWITDEGADRLVRNAYGSLDGIIEL